MSHSGIRYVFDTTVVVSALLFENGKPGQAFRRALRTGEILLSRPTLEELTEVLGRDKFDRYVTTAERDEFVEALVARAILLEPEAGIRECRDPKDDKFLDLAVSGGARFLISSDNDLLVLNPFRGIEVLSPADFLKAIEEKP